MKIFLDSEFLEAGLTKPLRLLSLALVAEDGRELYLVNRDCPVGEANDFVRRHVLPHIDLAAGVSLADMRRAVLDFVGPDRPEFWGAWASYDWVVLCGLIGCMSDLPKHWPQWIRELKQLSADLGDPAWPRQDRGQAHDALHDARWHRDVWRFLDGLAAARKSGAAAA